MTVGEYIEKLNIFDKNLEIKKKVYLNDEAFYFNVIEGPKPTQIRIQNKLIDIIEI